jgi:hypothetical protein
VTDWKDKTAEQILDDLLSMVRAVEAAPRPTVTSLGYAVLTPEEWHHLMWCGWWREYPPALDLWRLDLPDGARTLGP